MPSVSSQIEAEIEFEAFCGRCGTGICNNVSESNSRTRRMAAINIEPCEKCLKDAMEDARSEGYDAGHDAGYKEGQEAAETI